MPCKGCGSSTPNKLLCVTCNAKWCVSCAKTGTQLRSSGLKCIDTCVGHTSRYNDQRNKNNEKNGSKDELTLRNRDDYELCLAMKKAGYNINEKNRDDYVWFSIKDNWWRDTTGPS